MIVLGDISGIQTYLFDLAEAGGGQARRLRARSFFIQLLAEAAAIRVLRALGWPLDPDHFVLSGAGKFLLRGTSAALVENQLEAVRREMKAWLLTETRGELRLSLSWAEDLPLELVPEPLRGQWASRAEEGTVFLGLQDACALLEALGDELGTKFMQLQLHDRQKSPLTARNQSILAHGFERVSDRVFQQLWDAAVQLASVNESSLPLFPRLGE